jgi:hypothetical protein
MDIGELYRGGGDICTDDDNMDIKLVYEYLQGVRAWWQKGQNVSCTE